MSASSDALEELSALKAIYDNELVCTDEPNGIYTIAIKSESPPISEQLVLNIECIPSYPSESPPIFNVHAPWLRHKEIDALYTKLEETATSSIGSPVVYSLVENIRDFLDEPHLRNSRKTVDPTIVKRPAVEEPSYSKSSTLPSVKVHLSMAPAFLSIAQGFQCPEIYHGESIVDRKSIFQAHCCSVKSVGELSTFITTLLCDRKVVDATHNILAWCMNMPSGPNTSISPYHKNERICHMSDYDDDGETHAGQRLLHLLLISRVENVAVIVSRWYGGIQLGPDRFKHINNAAKLLLVQQGFITVRNGETRSVNEKKSKKKNRR